MKKQTGIWIDTKMAVIVSLKNNSHTVKTIPSFIEGRERIPGETKWFTRFGSQFLNFETRKKRRREKEIKDYLKNVASEIRGTDELVLFGPANIKMELEKIIRGDNTRTFLLRGIETADSMTENQMVAWVKNYYKNITEQ